MQETKKQLGLWTSTSLVVGNMIGAGVFMMPSTLSSFGGISLIGWVCSALGAFLIAKVFAHLSKLLPAADGGPYAYSQKGLGDFAGFLVAWGYLVSVWCTNAAITVSFISAMSTFFPSLATSPLLAISVGLATIWFLS
jgi:APA family basic amino acid/polyamine antiporter